MTKKKLNLDQLKVDSFVTNGEMVGGHYPTCDCSLETGFICEMECTDSPRWCDGETLTCTLP